jgi:hypothetical protein
MYAIRETEIRERMVSMTPNVNAPRASARDHAMPAARQQPGVEACHHGDPDRHTQQFRDEKTWFSVVPREHDQRQRTCRDKQHPLPDVSSESCSYGHGRAISLDITRFGRPAPAGTRTDRLRLSAARPRMAV